MRRNPFGAIIWRLAFYTLVGVGLHFAYLHASTSPPPGSPGYWVVIVLSSLFGGLTIMTLLNNVVATVFFFRKFGAIRGSLVSRTWKVRQRTPYNHRRASSKVQRAAYPTVIVMYLIYAAVMAGLALLFREHGWALIPASLALYFVTLIPMQVLIHGQPPAILLLGRSGPLSMTLHGTVARRFLFLGCVSLLDSDKSDDARLLKAVGAVVRTRGEHDPEWRESFRDLAAMSLVVVIDARVGSAIVQEEIDWLQAGELASKVVVVTPNGAATPGGLLFSTPAALTFVGVDVLMAEIARRTGFAMLAPPAGAE